MAERGRSLSRHPPIFRVISRFVLGYTRTIDTYLRDLAKALDERIEVRD